MKQNSAIKGYLYAFAASFALAASLIFSKSALNYTSIILFGFWWFGIGAVMNLIFLVFRSFYAGAKKKIRTNSLFLALAIAVLEGVATVSFYYAIQKMENPAVVSFIGNLGPVLVTIMGITLLKEKYSTFQLIGIVLALAGIFALTFAPGSGFNQLLQPGSEFVIFASVLFAIATILARKKNEILNPELMSTIRSFLLFFVFMGLVINSDTEIMLGESIWWIIILGSFLETLITIVFAYQALKYIEAAKTSLVISTKAVWILAGAYIFLHTFPSVLELTGGVLSLVGIGLITLKFNQRS